MNSSVRVHNADGTCLVRDNVLIAMFAQRPFAEVVAGAAQCFDRFIDSIPSDTLKWSVIGPTADVHKPLAAKDLTRCRSMLTASVAKQKDIHFRLMGPVKYGPDYSVMVHGERRPDKSGFLNTTNAIEMRFPREMLADRGEDAVVSLAAEMFDAFPCDSGYAAVSLCFGNETMFRDAGAQIAPLALKSHGYDVPNNLYTATGLGNRCRGARWVTMLSIALTSELGGADVLGKRLASGVEVIDAANGIILRAGTVPEIGDVNRKETTPLLQSIAHAIEPVTDFTDTSLLPLFGNDAERLMRWQRRFWWHS